MQRFYLPPDQCRGERLELTGREAHHALHVLRLKRGETLAVLDGAGHELLCRLDEGNRDRATLSVVQKNSTPPPPCPVTLLQAIPKGKIFDTIIQKATELGAARIVPLLSDRVVTQLDDESGAAKVEKWQQIAIEAIKQCGAGWLPVIEKPATPRDFLNRAEAFDLSLLASLQPDRKHPREHFQNFIAEKGRPPRSIAVWVGPEGDFTPAEINAIKAIGTLPITLGPLILRSETAAIYCLSVLSYELQICYP